MNQCGTTQSPIAVEAYLQGMYMVLSELARKNREHVIERLQKIKDKPEERFVAYEKLYYSTQTEWALTRKWIGKNASPGLDVKTIHSRAVVGIIAGETLPTEAEFVLDNFPETLRMDFERCGMLRREFSCLVTSYVALIAATQTESLPAMLEYLEDDAVGEKPDLHRLSVIVPGAKDVMTEQSALGKMLGARLCKLLLESSGEAVAETSYFPKSIHAPKLKKRADSLVWWVGRIKAANFTIHKELYETIVAAGKHHDTA